MRKSADEVLEKCWKSAEKVRESAEKCESHPFSHTIFEIKLVISQKVQIGGCTEL